MSEIADKVKDKLLGAKDKVVGTAKEGVKGTESSGKDDPLSEYEEKEPMAPAKIKEHEPTAVKRDMDERISEGGQSITASAEDAAEKARRSGITKGTAGAEEAANKYE